MISIEELRERRERLRGLPTPQVGPPEPQAAQLSEPPEPEPEDVKARWALRRFLAAIPIGRDLTADELRQAEALAVAWVQAVRHRDKLARRKQRRLERGGEWPED